MLTVILAACTFALTPTTRPHISLARASLPARCCNTVVASESNGELVAATPPESGGPISTETSLKLTAALLVLGVSVVVLRPTPALIEMLGAARATQMLSLTASASAALEIAASPVIGGLADAIGRRPALLGTLFVTLLSSVGAAAMTTAPAILAAKFVQSMAVGVFILLSSTILADSYRTEPKRLAAASSTLFAVVNLGFGVGVALTPRLPTGLKACYYVSSAALLAACAVAATTLRESLTLAQRVPFKAKAINPFACVRLFRAGNPLRVLAIITALNLQPLFMGDVPQLFAMSEWGLDVAGVSKLFTAVAATGVVSNLAAGKFIGKIGLRPFAAIATASSLIYHLGFCLSYRTALICACIGWLGPARAVAGSSLLTSVGARMGMPQGQLSGDRANLVAILKVLGPLVYGQAFLFGKAISTPILPFLLNAVLTLGALALWLGPFGVAEALVEKDDKGASA